MNERREKVRRELTQLLTIAQKQLELSPGASIMVIEYIENYEFGLAYELILQDMNENNVQPNGDAAASLREAAVIMRLEISN